MTEVVVRKSRPRTVVRIIDRLNVGGPAIHAVLTAARLAPDEFRTILVHGDIEPGEGDMGYLLRQYGVKSIHIPGLSRELRPLKDVRALIRLLRLMREERPDVVHTHKSKAGLIGRLAAVVAGVPVRIHTYHGHVLSGYFDKGRTTGLLWMERALALLSTRLITLSEELQVDLCRGLKIGDRERFRVIPLGLDLAPFRCAERERGALRRELGLHSDCRLIGMVGRMVPVKDHATFLQSLAVLCRERSNVHAVLVGGGELEGFLRARVAELGLSGRVSFLGWRRDLPRIYADLDLLVLTSRNEGTPVAVIEAMAAGIPVVATAVGGVPDVLRERGVLIPPGDEVKLTHAMASVLDSSVITAQARDPGRRDVICAEYGIDRLCADLARLYHEEICKHQGTERPRQGPAARTGVIPGHPLSRVLSSPGQLE